MFLLNDIAYAVEITDQFWKLENRKLKLAQSTPSAAEERTCQNSDSGEDLKGSGTGSNSTSREGEKSEAEAGGVN